MYITEIELRNIRSISVARWTVTADGSPGWHVIIGDNGSGKSTFLRSIALALVGPTEAAALRQDWTEWLAKGRPHGSISLKLHCDWGKDKWSGKGNTPISPQLPVKIALTRSLDDVRIAKATTNFDPDRYVWGNGAGWFSASYGPFRRFAGGDKDYEKVFYSNPRLAAHLSVFGENIALSECLRWLQDLQFKKLENDTAAGKLLDAISQFVNQEGFLPHQARLHSISSREVLFVDGNDCKLPVEELSDGYRSVLSMTFELIRQLSRVYDPAEIFAQVENAKVIVTAPGVVLIDEADVHLHPTWQRRIGVWLREHFPKIQFIVTTHSPLICQAADVGTVWRLPKPGTSEPGGRVSGVELERLLYGNVLDAYGTELFGGNVTRSDESNRRLHRLAELNVKELRAELTEDERKEQKALRAALPTSAFDTNPEANPSDPHDTPW
jgi:energy-coupling factor transporter ATP-binding protein EcfA2